MEILIQNTKVVFELNVPVEETGFISENFDFLGKPAYATIGVSDLISEKFDAQPVIFKIFQTLRNQASVQKLDYLQKITINDTMCWVIDNGAEITLLLPSEY